MKQIVPFTKKISFDTSVDEITSISLDRKIKNVEDSIISGVFDLYLEYKESDISVNTLKYNSSIPFDIDIDDRYSLKDVKVDIDDFYYEIDDDDVVLHIDVLIDNLEYMKKEEVIEKLPIEIEDEIIPIDDLNIDIRNNNQKQESEERIDIKKDITLDSSFDVNEITSNLTSSFLAGEEHFSTYKIHIIREEETINTVMEKYKISKDELEKYNTLDNVMLGTKIIIPIKDEE